MNDFGIKKTFELLFLNKKVINITSFENEDGWNVCLLFETGYRLNFTYNKTFLQLGEKISREVLEKDINEILGNENHNYSI